MRFGSHSTIFACVFILYVAVATAQSAPKPTTSADPIPAEQMSIYRTFLAGYNNGSKSVLNIAQTTEPFEAEKDELSECMKSFNKTNSRSTVVHIFRPDAFPKDTIRLVDPESHQISDPGTAIQRGKPVDDAVDSGFAAGLFTFSEIVFDTSHTHAAFSYRFHCGSLCGHGATVVFILEHGKWKRSKANCGSWIS